MSNYQELMDMRFLKGSIYAELQELRDVMERPYMHFKSLMPEHISSLQEVQWWTRNPERSAARKMWLNYKKNLETAAKNYQMAEEAVFRYKPTPSELEAFALQEEEEEEEELKELLATIKRARMDPIVDKEALEGQAHCVVCQVNRPCVELSCCGQTIYCNGCALKVHEMRMNCAICRKTPEQMYYN